MLSTCYSFHILTKIEFSRQIIEKIIKFNEIWSSGSRLGVSIFSNSPLQQVGIDFLMGLRWMIYGFVIRDALYFVKVLKKEALNVLETSTNIHPNTRCHNRENSSLHAEYLIP
jgi:hypothetical protein